LARSKEQKNEEEIAEIEIYLRKRWQVNRNEIEIEIGIERGTGMERQFKRNEIKSKSFLLKMAA